MSRCETCGGTGRLMRPSDMSGVDCPCALVKQRGELQARMDEMVEASRHRRVRAFMAMAGQDLPPHPQVPTDAVVRMRLRIVAEEFFELLESSLGEWKPEPWIGGDAKARVEKLIDVCPVRVDLPKFVDATIDLDYVVEGARQAFGVHGPPFETAVHAANMEKGKGPLRADGKKEKPPGWKPPDIDGLLRAQGWRP